jgi:glycosyltransferase involved in cell wall biosynthesis
MQVWAIGIVRNEADLVRVNVLHHLAQGIDRILLLDDGSTDGTRDVLAELSRDHPVECQPSMETFRQDRLLTALARTAFIRGAEWILPIDADEFWYAPSGTIRDLLVGVDAGAIAVDVVNFVQRREQHTTTPDGLLHMTRRVEQPVGTDGTIAGLVESERVAYVEIRYPRKWIIRAGARLEIGWGNHTVRNSVGPSRYTQDIVCLHAPLRSRTDLNRKADLERAVAEVGEYLEEAWHLRRWRRLAAEGQLDAEWRANSYAENCLDVQGLPHPLVRDDRLRDLVSRWLSAQVATSQVASLQTDESSPRDLTSLEPGTRAAILDRMRKIEGWFDDDEAELLIRVTVELIRGLPTPHTIVEVGSYCGRSTVVLGGAVRALGGGARIYAVDPHEGEIGAIDGTVGLRSDGPTLERFLANVEAARLGDLVEPIVQRSTEVDWRRPVGLLFVDGLHDYVSVRGDVDHFGPWLVPGGYLAFHDHRDEFPGVRACVRELLATGAYSGYGQAGSLVVLRKDSNASSPSPEPAGAPPSDAVRCLEIAVAGYRTQVAVRDEALGTLRAQAQRRDAVIAGLADELDHERLEVQRRHGQVTGLSEEVQILQAQAMEREGTIQSLSEELGAQRSTITRLGDRVEELLASKSWRLTAPLRAIQDLISGVRSTASGAHATPSSDAVAVGAEANLRNWTTTLARQYDWQRGRPAWTQSLYVALGRARANSRPRRILVIDRSLPTPDRDSGSMRMFMLLRLLSASGWTVTFLPADLRDTEPYASDLRRLGIRLLVGEGDAEAILRREGGGFGVVLCSRPEQAEWMLPLLRAYAVGAAVVYDTVDLHWVRMEREFAVTGDPVTAAAARQMKAIELAAAKAADLVFTVTAEDRAALLAECPGCAIAVVPNVHEVTRLGPPYESRADLLFLGGFLHKPNEDAVLYFVERILPLVHARRLELRLVVVGSDPPPSIQACASEQISITGYVPDVAPYLARCRVFVAPLRFGAGLKGKIGQALAAGVPVVTTSIGAEGFGLTHQETAMIADDPDRFAESVVRVYSDPALWRRLAESGRRAIRDRFSPAVVGRQLTARLDAVRRAASGV